MILILEENILTKAQEEKKKLKIEKERKRENSERSKACNYRHPGKGRKNGTELKLEDTGWKFSKIVEIYQATDLKEAQMRPNMKTQLAILK